MPGSSARSPTMLEQIAEAIDGNREKSRKFQAEALFCYCTCFVLISFFSSNTDESAIRVIEPVV